MVIPSVIHIVGKIMIIPVFCSKKFCSVLGLNCSIIANCNNVLNCSSNGDCVDMDVCKCHIGYNGSSCNEFSCESLGYCSGTFSIFALARLSY